VSRQRTWVVAGFVMATSITAACQQSEQDRTRDATARAQLEANDRASAVVRGLETPRDSGRLIYDRPVDLSYANLRLTRPDLIRSSLGTRR
jgi:hypothetical protein